MKVQLVSFFDESPRVRRFRFRYQLDPEAFDQALVAYRQYAGLPATDPVYRPGQYVSLLAEGVFEHARSYSICQWLPDLEFELCIVLNQEGAFTRWLFEQKPGAVLECTPPLGRFVLEDDSLDTRLLFIATGTGLAPLIPMVEQALKRGHQQVHLYAGHRYAEDELFQKELQNLQAEFPQLEYVATGSREPIRGQQGYVHALYEQHLKSQPIRFYACGWKAMLNECRDRLKQAGFTRRDYRIEAYD